MLDLMQTIQQLIAVLGTLVIQLFTLALQWSLLLAFIAIFLLAVNWKKMWSVLAAGAWVPVVLLAFVAAMVWTFLEPGNFWWRLFGVSLVVGGALFLGWLQGVLGWTPPEINLEPPAPADHHHHGHH